jgi:hypothetical protein
MPICPSAIYSAKAYDDPRADPSRPKGNHAAAALSVHPDKVIQAE